MSHRIITTIRDKSSLSSPKKGGLYISFPPPPSRSSAQLLSYYYMAHPTHNSVVCRLRKISTTLATTTTTTTRKRREKTSQSRTTLHKQVGFSFIIITIIFFRTFPFLERLYIWHGRRSFLLSPQSPCQKKKTPRSVSCNARMYIQTGSNSWSPWTAEKRIDPKMLFRFLLNFFNRKYVRIK